MISLETIENAKHIVIVTGNDSFADASALYTFILRLHKKVSIVSEKEDIDSRFSFLPWFEKLRKIVPSSADLVIDLELETQSIYAFFKSKGIAINQKMATALYAGFLKRFHGLVNNRVDGTIFAVLSELIANGADYKQCNKFIIKRVSLSTLRLKAIMLKNMLLINDSKAALFCVNENDFKSSGASLSEAYVAMNEALCLPYVEVAILINSENEVLKLIIEEI